MLERKFVEKGGRESGIIRKSQADRSGEQKFLKRFIFQLA